MEPLLLYFKEEFIEFWSIDQNGRVIPVLYNSSNRLPLYFLLSGDQIMMDNYAKDSFLKSINGSFGNFWENLGSNSLKYDRFGSKHDFDTLLPYSLKETVLPSILKSHFHNNNFSEFIQSKNTFILYDSFVHEEHREIINKYFLEIIGYAPNLITFLNYWDVYRSTQIVNKLMISEESFLFVNASLGNVILHLIGKNQSNHVIKKVIEGKGRDPRVDTILDFIAEIAIAKGSQMKISEIKKEIANDGPKVLDLLKDGLVMYTIKNDNIGVNPLKLNFHRNEVEGRLNNKQSLNLVQNEFDIFRRSNNADQLSIFLVGDVINQPVFVDFFKSTYSKVFPQNENFDKLFLEEVLKNCNNILYSNVVNTTSGFNSSQTSVIIPTPPIPPTPQSPTPPPSRPAPPPPAPRPAAATPPPPPSRPAPPPPAPRPAAATPPPPPSRPAPPPPAPRPVAATPPPPPLRPVPPPPAPRPVAATPPPPPSRPAPPPPARPAPPLAPPKPPTPPKAPPPPPPPPPKKK
jgi:hypothetical protein